MKFTLDVSGLRALQARIQFAIEDNVTYTLMEGLQNASDDAVKRLQEESPYDASPNNGVIPGEEGHLSDSFHANEVQDNGDDVVSNTVITQEPIKFQYVTQGTASPIQPKEKKALWWPDAGVPRRSVRGQQANPFHYQVQLDVLKNGDTYFASALAKLKADLEG